MKKILTISFLFLYQFSFAQNLVNNWSFEDSISCPIYYSQIDKAIGWSTFRETPDYYNACNHTYVGVPSNNAGFQYASTGDAYAGIIVYATFTNNFREVMGAQLSQNLTIGQKYFISFQASLGYYPNNAIYILPTNKICLRFSNFQYSLSNPTPINNHAHICSNFVIWDTLNWTTITGSFIADSNYSFLEIGNFFDDTNTVVQNIDTSIFQQYSYFLIDDIKVSTDSSFVNTAIENYSSDVIKVFPNPARDWIVLEGKGIKSVEILNALGSEIGSYPTTAFTLRHQINFGTLSRGIYFLKVNMIDDKFHFQKIIVQY